MLEAQWCLYSLFLSFFHFSEFIVTAINQPNDVSYDSFLINHSKAYCIAALCSWVEFWVEAWLYPWMKGGRLFLALGLCMMLLGQCLRTNAMCTAGSNFTHIVAFSRRPSHQLVERGVYAFFRHPAYLGWFFWSIGTQVALGNPICSVGYALAAWSFFADRIPAEEVALLNMFGSRYAEYASKTIIGIPWIYSPARLSPENNPQAENSNQR